MFVYNLSLRGKSMLCTRDHEHFKLRDSGRPSLPPWSNAHCGTGPSLPSRQIAKGDFGFMCETDLLQNR